MNAEVAIRDERGLYGKYKVRYADGSPLSPGLVFVLRPDRDPAAWEALFAYAKATENLVLRADLLCWLAYNPKPAEKENDSE